MGPARLAKQLLIACGHRQTWQKQKRLEGSVVTRIRGLTVLICAFHFVKKEHMLGVCQQTHLHIAGPPLLFCRLSRVRFGAPTPDLLADRPDRQPEEAVSTVTFFGFAIFAERWSFLLNLAASMFAFGSTSMFDNRQPSSATHVCFRYHRKRFCVSKAKLSAKCNPCMKLSQLYSTLN